VISVDVARAAYPVTIDPIIANGNPHNANKVIQIDQSYMWLGYLGIQRRRCQRRWLQRRDRGRAAV
jgi:hypothetical protein